MGRSRGGFGSRRSGASPWFPTLRQAIGMSPKSIECSFTRHGSLHPAQESPRVFFRRLSFALWLQFDSILSTSAICVFSRLFCSWLLGVFFLGLLRSMCSATMARCGRIGVSFVCVCVRTQLTLSSVICFRGYPTAGLLWSRCPSPSGPRARATQALSRPGNLSADRSGQCGSSSMSMKLSRVTDTGQLEPVSLLPSGVRGIPSVNVRCADSMPLVILSSLDSAAIFGCWCGRSPYERFWQYRSPTWLPSFIGTMLEGGAIWGDLSWPPPGKVPKHVQYSTELPDVEQQGHFSWLTQNYSNFVHVQLIQGEVYVEFS